MKPIQVRAIEYVKIKLFNIPIVKQIHNLENNSLYDIEITMKNEDTIRLKVFSFVEFFPKYIKEIIAYKSEMNREIQCVIVAPYISEKGHNLCVENSIGYFDYSGNLFFSSNAIYLLEKGNPNAYKPRKSKNDIFKPKSLVSSKILRILIKNKDKSYTLKSLSKEASCSIGQVSKVKDALCNGDFAKYDVNGLMITDVQSLMKEWSIRYTKKEQEEVLCYTLESLPNFEQNLKVMKQTKDIDYYLTAISGGVRYAPMVRYNKIHVYISSNKVRQAIDFLGCKEVSDGANILIYPINDEIYTYDSRMINGSSVASPVQIYLDSMLIKGRGEEMAEALLRKDIV